MKAVRFHRHGGPEVLAVEEIEIPRPGPGEVRVRVEAAGVNYSDTVRRWGDHYPVPTPLPYVAGNELVGLVDAVGPGVDTGLIGERVLGAPEAGAYAEFAIVPVERVFPFPPGVTPVDGVALFIQGLSAALILKETVRLRPGESVFIEGASGGVGGLAVQLARLYGAKTIIGGASSDEKRAQARALGADAAIDYGVPGWSEEVLRLTGGRGVNVVLEMTGGDVFPEALRCLAAGGRLAIYGVASRKPYAVPSAPLIARGHSIAGFSIRLFFPHHELIVAILRELAGFVAAGVLKVGIGGTLPLDQAAEAHRAIEARQTTGKLILVP